MEKLVAMMAFCEAPLDGTLADPSGSASGTAGGCSNVVALLEAAAKKLPPVEKLVATMAFCEAPFDGIFDGTASAPSSGAAGGTAREELTSPRTEAGGVGGEDAAALRRAWLADAKKAWPVREKAGNTVVVDGLAIFRTVAME